MKTRALAVILFAVIFTQAQAQHHGRWGHHHAGLELFLNPLLGVAIEAPLVVWEMRNCAPKYERVRVRVRHDEVCDNVVSGEEFLTIKHRLSDMTYDRERLEYIDRKLALHFFTSSQVRFMVGTLALEQNKLDIAKEAFTRTVDPANYDLVFDALEYESSKHNLDDYIENLATCRK